jgi:hypothetical protein
MLANLMNSHPIEALDVFERSVIVVGITLIMLMFSHEWINIMAYTMQTIQKMDIYKLNIVRMIDIQIITASEKQIISLAVFLLREVIMVVVLNKRLDIENVKQNF